MGLLSWLRKHGKSADPEVEVQVDLGKWDAEFVHTSTPEQPSPGIPPRPPRIWTAPGQSASVREYRIPDGMVYIGEANGEPSAIDPRLEVTPVSDPSRVDLPGYYPSYAKLSAVQRGAYLRWLADGRRSPDVNIGFVFLFKYGLERRVIVDIANNPGWMSEELFSIHREMSELLSVYGPGNGSFQSYGRSFLNLVEAYSMLPGARPMPVRPPPLIAEKGDAPFLLKAEIGQSAARSRKITADRALAWAWYLPTVRLRVPATRCTEEFLHLFTIRYDEMFPGGIPVRAVKKTLRVQHFVANPSLRGATLKPTSIPDVFEQAVPARRLAELFNRVTEELAAYSRFLGTNQARRETLAALSLLPRELIANPVGAVCETKDFLLEVIDEAESPFIEGHYLIHLWDRGNAQRLSRKDSVFLAQVLGEFGIGMEPDIRFGGPPLSADMQVGLFHLGSRAISSPSAEYSAATTVAHLASVVANADNDLDDKELAVLQNHLVRSLDLGHEEQLRLSAHLKLLSYDNLIAGFDDQSDRPISFRPGKRKNRWQVLWDGVPVGGVFRELPDGTYNSSRPQMPRRIHTTRQEAAQAVVDRVFEEGGTSYSKRNNMATMKKRIEPLHPAMRQNMASSLVTLVAADGRIDPAEVNILTRMFKLLGVNPAAIPGQIHAAIASPTPTYAPRQSVSGPLLLDQDLIARKMSETAEVTSLLGAIFAEPEPVQPQIPAESSRSEAVLIDGLDASHGWLLQHLATQPVWRREAFESLVAERALMPDGAIDVLNELGYERSGEPVIEGDDELVINTYALEAMLQ